MCGISAYAGLFQFIMFSLRRERRVNLFFALTCFSVAFYDAMSVGLYNSVSVDAGALWQRGQFFAMACLGGNFLLFVFDLYEKPATRLKLSFLSFLVVLIALGLVFPGGIVSAAEPNVRSFEFFGYIVTYYEAHMGIVFDLLSLWVAFGMVYVIVVAVPVVRDRKDALYFLFGMGIFFLSISVDILVGCDVFLFLYTSEYSFFILIILMDLAVQKRYSSLFREIEALNAGLEARIERRTQEITGLVSQLYSKNAELQDKNAILAELADRDGLTKLLNHAAFHRRLAEEFSASRRQLFSLSLIMIDIDRFKEINDTYGHQVGDRVLLMVAEVLRHDTREYDSKSRLADESGSPEVEVAEGAPNIRLYDVSGRYGGDEFALLLPYCDAGDALVIAERVRKRIEAIAVPDLPDLRVGASLGCTIFEPETGGDYSVADFMQEADRALYKAKEAGRGQTVVAGGPRS
jgi:GGDEF domain-containing protein